MRYTFDIVHVPGKQLYTADTLSRAPVNKLTEGDSAFEEEVTAYVNLIMQTLPASDHRLEQIMLNTKQHGR